MSFRRLRWMATLSLCSMALAAPALTKAVSASERSVGTPHASGLLSGKPVTGLALAAGNTPISNAKLRLRDVRTGVIAAFATSNAQGEFGFSDIEEGWYAVELVGDDGKLLAVGQPFRVARGETSTTVVRIPPQRPRWAGILSNTAVAVIGAASSAGVTALGSAAPPASPY